MMIEYEDMAAYGARTAFENANAEWRICSTRRLITGNLLSVELLTEPSG